MLEGRRRRSRLGLLAVALAVAVAGIVVLAGRVPAVESLRWRTSDAFFPTAGEARPVVVLVDRTRAAPELLRRDAAARLVAELDAAGATSIVIEPSVLVLPQAGLTEAVAAAGNVAAAMSATGSVQVVARPGRPWAPLTRVGGSSDLGLSAAAAASGLPVLSTETPTDDRHRSVALVTETSDGLTPSLQLAAVAVARGLDATDLRLGERHVELDGWRIPTGPNGSMLLDYVDDLEPARVLAEALRAEDVIAGDIEPDAVRGRVVLVGDPNTDFADLDAPAGSSRSPTIVLRAVVVHTLLGDVPVPIGTLASLAGLVLLALAIVVVGRFLPPWTLLVAVAVAVGAVVLGTELALEAGVLLDPAGLIGDVGLASVVGLGWRGSAELRRRRAVTALFGAYVSPAVAAHLLADDQVSLAEQRRDVAVLFADLRGFTTFSRDADPVVVRQLVEVFYELVVDAALEREGTVMQFIGDEVFVVFGAPLDQPDAAARAVDCARAVLVGRPDFERRTAAAGAGGVGFGIGVHAGEVVAVHAGTSLRRQYTVLGHTVNLGARICSVAKAGEALVSAEVAMRVGDPGLEPAGAVELKGLDRPVEVYRIRDRDG